MNMKETRQVTYYTLEPEERRILENAIMLLIDLKKQDVIIDRQNLLIKLNGDDLVDLVKNLMNILNGEIIK